MQEPNNPGEGPVSQLGILFEQSPFPMWLLHARTGRILAANEAAVREYGFAREDFLQRLFDDLASPDDGPEDVEEIASLTGTVIRRSNQRHVKADGGQIDVIVTSQDVPWENEVLHLVTAQNITARRRASDRLTLVLSVTASLSEALTPEQVAAAVVDEGVRALGAHSGSLSIVEDDFLTIIRAVGYSAEVVERWRRHALSEHFPLADAVRSGEPIILTTAEERGARYPHLAQLRANNGAGSMAALPLTVEGKAIGALGLSFPPEVRIGEEERALMLNLAQQSAQALHRARLFEEESRSRQAAERLQSLSAALSQAAAEEEVADVAVRHGMAALGADAGVMAQPDKVPGTYRLTSSIGYPEPFVQQFRQFDLSASLPLATAVRTGKPVLLESFEARREAYPHLAELWRGMGGEALACLPLIVSGRTLGSIAFSFSIARTFSDADVGFLQALSQQAAQAVERATLFTALRRSRDEAQLLAEASRALSSSLDYSQTLSTVATLAVPTFADWCVVDLVDEENGEIRRVTMMHSDPERRDWAYQVADAVVPTLEDETGIGAVIRTGEPMLVPVVTPELLASEALSDKHAEVWTALQLSSVITAPMGARGKVLGAMTFLMSESKRHYTEHDLGLAIELARRAAIAVENATLYAAEQEAREEAERASQAKSQFLAVMSHELRTPLNAIFGYADLIEAEVGGPLNSSQRVQVGRILDSARHLRELIDQVLSLARIEAGREEVFLDYTEVKDVVDQVLSLIKPLAAQKQLELRRHTPSEEIWIRSDGGKIKQVLLNLVGNAIKYTEVGCVDVTLTADEEQVAFEVRDTGVGIMEDDLTRIFEPFTQVDQSMTRRVGGSGLGLPISRRLARLLGGDVTVTSVEGKGSTFTFSLPRLSTET